MSEELAELAASLEARLGRVLGAPVAVRDLRRLSGGASRETWAFDVSGDGLARSLVLRRDPPGHGRPEAMARDAAALAAAARAGVPEPPVVDADTDAAVLGAPYVITEFVPGETIPRRLLRDPAYAPARARLARDLGRVLARLHTIPPSAVPGLAEPREPADDPLDTLVAAYDRLGEPLPAVEIALHWLRRNRPDPVPDTVVHGDFRNGNLIIGEDGLRAVLDWEIVHRGDPREDLGWLCVKAWRFGSAHPVGGFGDRDALLDGYAEVAGRRPDAEAVRWWEVYGTARWAVGCRGQAERHLSGETRSVELAAIGRRVCEQEHDLLLALPDSPRQPREAPPLPSPSSVPAADGRAAGGPAAQPRAPEQGAATGNAASAAPPSSAAARDGRAPGGPAGQPGAPEQGTAGRAASETFAGRGAEASSGAVPALAEGDGGRGRPAAGEAADGDPSLSDLHGRPSMAELVEAVEGFLREDVMTAVEPRLAFHARVAANVLAIVGRELRDRTGEDTHREALRALGAADRVRLAAAIRDGRIDPDDPATRRAVRDIVTARLRVANPRYLSHPG